MHGVDAAVVELDPLADAVRPAAEDDDLLLRRRPRLDVAPRVSRADLVGRVEVRRVRLELGGAGVDALEDRADAVLAGAPARTSLLAACRHSFASCRSRMPSCLRSQQRRAVVQQRRRASRRRCATVSSASTICRRCAQEPRVDLGRARERLAVDEAGAHRLGRAATGDRALGVARSARFELVERRRRVRRRSKPAAADLQRAQRLAAALSLNVRPIAITSPTDFICVVERRRRRRGTSRTRSAAPW